ncbi:cobyrinic acid a,c-diamide synthase [Fictibacillus macauensis ZFHKF-1]|uniref:Cobyrinate a,c-diamide synthase n=1 Tax=Fictibacillus macauensis ZFHKF-1 TaxID=1196324 RepID=I8UHW1_9BACL|nr:cobyrinate a,c-diamide synthase [Fictibacillus macauensis]EIT86460.1 cobyrinic acid a,c-diamide synthase [Fictibacillus macauensis ZFHKF-1]
MGNKRIVIAGTGSGVGKTTVTIGIMKALHQRGLTVQGFKCGPDYIDPTYHTAVTGRVSRNLDSWMTSKEAVMEIAHRGQVDADIAVVEGVMGFFDGKDPRTNAGSTAEVAMLTESPVILVVNCASMARSAAAIVKGFQMLATGPNIVGVIANKVGSKGHFNIVKTAIEQECHVPVIGYLSRHEALHIPERHLGLIPSIERGDLDPFFNELGQLVEETIDLDLLLQLAEAPALTEQPSSLFATRDMPPVNVAVARDSAFNFYYEENLELLRAYGAHLHFFSPLKGEVVPADAQALYIGGGFPEEFAKELSQMTAVKQSIKQAIQAGIPTLAECGGFMYLTEAIQTTDGATHEMVGVIPGTAVMQRKRAALGYREITVEHEHFLLKQGQLAKGHEFHYSTFQATEDLTYAYETKGMRGVKKEGYRVNNLVAGYAHFHFASSPEMVENWMKVCQERKQHA